jgi:hypothetical protein
MVGVVFDYENVFQMFKSADSKAYLQVTGFGGN